MEAGGTGRVMTRSRNGRHHDPFRDRVKATDAALVAIERLKARHGPLVFVQSGGCCDGTPTGFPSVPLSARTHMNPRLGPRQTGAEFP